MASPQYHEYNPGLLGVKSPLNCSCQDILSALNPTQYGWLRRRCFRNKLHVKLKIFDWPQVYVVVVDKCLYYFKNETSKKPSGSVSLYGYNRVFRSAEIKASEAPWSFKIEHIQPDMKSFYFSASSKQEMMKWMKSIKDEMLAANNMEGSIRMRSDSSAQSDESLSSWGSSEYNSIECGIYGDGSSLQCRQSVLSEAPLDGDSFDSDSDIHTTYECPVLPESPAPSEHAAEPEIHGEKGLGGGTLQNAGEQNEELNTDNESIDYWAAIHFSGSKVEASEVINGIAVNGVYLVRKSEDGLNVLQVYADDISRKYRIFINDKGQHTLSLANGPGFETLEDLLFHFYSKTLPHSSHCLTMPYRLHPEFINNERH